MPLAPLHQPADMITPGRQACGPGGYELMVSARGEATYAADDFATHAPPRNAACSLSSHLQCENLLLDLLALGDKCIYCCVGIGAGMINVRPLPFLDQFRLAMSAMGH